MTTGEITKQAIKVLNLMGFEAWRQNQIRVPGRTFIGKLGLSDILGYERLSGRFLLCEVKNKGDVMSKEQEDLLNHATECGCATYVATVDKSGGFELKKYEPKNN